MLYVAGAVGVILVITFVALMPFFLLLYLGELALTHFSPGRGGRLVLIMLKNLRRNPLRTSLTYLATFVLVFVVAMVWSVLYYLDSFTGEKTKDLTVVVVEKWQLNSQMPMIYARPLEHGGVYPPPPGAVQPQDSMTWQIYFGSLDRAKLTRDNMVVFIALEPDKIPTMLNDIFGELSADPSKQAGKLSSEQAAQMRAAVETMNNHKPAVILGPGRLQAINKKVGDRITVYGQNYLGLELEVEIIGTFPPAGGRYNEIGVMNRDYLKLTLDAYEKSHGGAHPMASKSLNMVWLRVRNLEEFNQMAQQIESSPEFRAPAVRCQTLSAEINSRMEGLKDMVWGIRWLIAPVILVTMALVLSNAISLGVRERRAELAVLKVLGFGPGRVLTLVLGEAVMIGFVAGLLSVLSSYVLIDKVLTNWTPTAIISAIIYIPENALWLGPLVGGLTALVGSLLPAWSACQVKVSEVFARVA
jgi:putative ABC transport system permease protein